MTGLRGEGGDERVKGEKGEMTGFVGSLRICESQLNQLDLIAE